MTKKIFNLFLTLALSSVLVVGCMAQRDKPPEKPPKPPERIIEKDKPKPTPPPKKPN
jgi:hypothetical protein